MNPFPIILSAPSGGGKTTIARKLLTRRKDIGYSVSCTTRPRRDGEEHGVHYYFLDEREFVQRRDRDEFAEWAEVHGKMYGTLRSEVRAVLREGRHVLMDIDVQGAQQFVAAFPKSVTIFIMPPSAEVLLQRLTARNTESRETLVRRLRSAHAELESVGRYHYVVVNDQLERAIDCVSSIIDAEGARHDRVDRLEERVTSLIAGLEQEIVKQSTV